MPFLLEGLHFKLSPMNILSSLLLSMTSSWHITIWGKFTYRFNTKIKFCILCKKKKILLVLNMNGWDTVISFESQPFVILPKKNPRV